MNCGDCTLCLCSKLVNNWPADRGMSKLAIVLEMPDFADVLAGKPLCSAGGQLLKSIFSAFDCNPEDVYITYVQPCLPTGNLKQTPEDKNRCRQRLIHELRSYQPDRILTLGVEAFETLLPQVTNTLGSVRGETWYSSELGVLVYPTLHPAYVLKQPNAFNEFANDIRRFVSKQVKEFKVVTWNLITSVAQLDKLEETYVTHYATKMSIDIETTGLDIFGDCIMSLGFAFNTQEAFIIPEEAVRNPDFLHRLRKFIENKDLFIITHNGISFDDPFVRDAWEIDQQTQMDTMLLHYLTDERKGTHALEEVGKTLFGLHNYKAEVKSAGHSKVAKDILYQYQAMDICLTMAIYDELIQTIHKENLLNLYVQRVAPSARALSRMEGNGVLIDVPHLKEVGKQLLNEAHEMTKKLQEEIEETDFNPKSPKQVAELIYDRFGWATIRGKGRGTAVEVLEKLLANRDPESWEVKIVNDIIDIRQKFHLEATYVRGILTRLSPDGRIRTQFKVHGTETGRLSSSDPNLQNIPQLIGPMFKNAFVAPPGRKLVEGDYSQLELRVGAWYSKDPAYTQAFIDGVDIHASVAAQVYNIPIEQVTHEQRHFAKFYNFGLPYGRGWKSIADQMGVAPWVAKAFCNDYEMKYATHVKWMNKIKKIAVTEGELITPTGRRRRFPLVTEENRHMIEREALNFPVQSLAADICLGSIVRLDADIQYRQKANLGPDELSSIAPGNPKLVLTVHDSILIECDEDKVDEVVTWKRQVMEDVPFESPYPWTVEIKTGDRWGELQKVGK